LETRTLLSVNFTEGELAITGTEGGDSVTIRSMPGNRLRVGVNREVSFFTKSEVTKIFIDALGGDDRIEVIGGGPDGGIDIAASILGGAGNDRITGASGNDNIEGGDGDDLLLGTKGNDTILGGAGDDRIFGDGGDDVLRGDDGDDTVISGPGVKDADGGAGENVMEQAFKPQFPIQTYTGTPTGYTPAQQRQAYGLGNLNDKGYTNRGKGQVIVIVDAYHAPNARRDLIHFAREMRTLPGVKNLGKYFKTRFHQVFANGHRPVYNEDWNGEAILDIQWAHAIAPEAKIILVESDSNAFGDIMQAIDKGVDILNRSRHRGGSISLSLGSDFDQPFQEALNSVFASEQARNISFIVAAGDTGGVPSFPATSPHVTAIGGTTLYLDDFGNRVPGNQIAVTNPLTGLLDYSGDVDCVDMLIPGGERPWWQLGQIYPVGIGGGGGPSNIFPTPAYQENRGIPTIGRGTPDISLNADPRTGVSVWNSRGSGGQSGWFTVGGTSAGAPQFAAMVALVNQLRVINNKKVVGGSLQDRIYRIGQRGPDATTYDIGNPAIHGTGVLLFPPPAPCDNTRIPPGWQWFSDPGWDYATGFGVPNMRAMIPALADQKPVRIQRSVTVNGTFLRNQPVIGGPSIFQTVQFQGNTSIQGFYTLNMPATTLRQTFSSGGTGTVVFRTDLFGMDAQTGIALPPTVNPATGVITVPGTPIVLSRNGNTVTGLAFMRVAQTTVAGPIVTTNVISGGIRIEGRINKGKFTGTFRAINPDGTFVTSAQAFRLGIPLISGRFNG
jgi:hypothetical protein